MDEFIMEFNELSKKYGIFLGARHDFDSWYAPYLYKIDPEKENSQDIIAECFSWEGKRGYTYVPTQEDEEEND